MVKKNWRKRSFLIKRKNIAKLLILIVLGMTVGFAAINTTLKLVGTLEVAKTTWIIEWENPSATGGVTPTSAPTVNSEDPTKVEYQVTLSDPGDYFEFTVDARNKGTIDAMITNVENVAYENNTQIAWPTFIENEVTYSDGTALANDHYLKAGTKESFKVKLTYKTGLKADNLPPTSKTYKFVFTLTYMQADEHATDRPKLWSLPEGKTATTLSLGDEICLTADPTQCFNFIKYDGTNNEDVVMLSKYNLNVGPNAKGTATNKQDSDVKGYVDSGTKYGNVAFSSTNYWYDGSALKPEYGSSYPADVYDPVNYKTEPDFSTTCDSTNCYYTPGYSVAYYVEAYKTILTGYGAKIKDARLLKYSEATDSSIGCDGSNFSCPTTGFITNTSFWLGSARDYLYVWVVGSDGGLYYHSFDNDNYFGVRPVITLSKSQISS